KKASRRVSSDGSDFLTIIGLLRRINRTTSSASPDAGSSPSAWSSFCRFCLSIALAAALRSIEAIRLVLFARLAVKPSKRLFITCEPHARSGAGHCYSNPRLVARTGGQIVPLLQSAECYD